MLIGLAFAIVFKDPIFTYTGQSLTPVFLIGLAVGSFLPDIDHPQATINQKLLPIHSNFIKLIVYGCAGWMIISIFATNHIHSTKGIAFALMGVFFILSGLSGHRGFTHKIPGILLYSAAAYLLATTFRYAAFTIGPILGHSISLGYSTALMGSIFGYSLHVAADALKSRFDI